MRETLDFKGNIHLLLTIMALLIGCAPETAVSPTPLPATATVTAAMPLTATAIPSTATPLPTTTAVPSTATATPQMVTATPAATATPPVETHLLTTEPVFVGGGVRLLDWSPDGRYLAYFTHTEEQMGLGGKGTFPPGTFTIYDTATAAICPVYVQTQVLEMLIKSSLDQGPFILTLTGEVRPILPLFNLELEPGQTEFWANGFVDPETGHYHILLEGATQGGEIRLPSKVYHSDTNSVEVLPTTPPDFSLEPWVYLDPDGTLSAPEGKRPITAVGAPFTPPPPGDDCPDPYRTNFIANQFALSYHTSPGCDIETQWRLAYLAQYDFSANAYALFLSPPADRWLAVALYDELTAMLFILDLENPT